MKSPILLLKGMAVGVSNLIPGVSAATLLVLLGIYDELVEAAGNFLTDKSRRKDYFLFLLPLGVGAVGGALTFANLITFLLERYAAPTHFFFMGLVLGSIPAVFGMHHDMRLSKSRAIAFALGLGTVVLLAVGERRGIEGFFSLGATSLWGLLLLALVGFLGGGAMVTPGVSGAYVFLLTGAYEPIMEALASMTRPPLRWEVLLAATAGAAAGILACSRWIDRALKRRPAITLYAILGLISGSLVGLWPAGVGLSPSSLVCIPTFATGVVVASLLNKLAGRRLDVKWTTCMWD